MNNSEFIKLAGLLAKIAYEVHDNKCINDELSEMLLDLWREFDYYNHLDD